MHVMHNFFRVFIILPLSLYTKEPHTRSHSMVPSVTLQKLACAEGIIIMVSNVYLGITF